MAFTSISSALITVGKAITRNLWLTTKDNFDDHETRIAGLETAGSIIPVFDETIYVTSRAASLTGMLFFKAKQAMKIVKVQVQIFDKGAISSGTVSLDLKKGATLTPGAFATILTTQASVNFATDPDYTANDAVINASLNSLAIDQYVRADFTSLPTIPLGKCRVIVYGEIDT